MKKAKSPLIKKLFEQKCSQDELILLFEMLQEDEEDSTPEIMTELLEQMDPSPVIPQATSDKILAQVMHNINVQKSAKVTPVRRIARRRSLVYLGRIAAAVLVVLVGTWTALELFNSPGLVVQKTSYGEQKEFRLPDNSIVTLNGNSTLEYQSNWEEGETRIVYLKGEAFFEVEKKVQTNAKFQVITRDMKIEVLGTAFNVNTRQEATKVYLEEGKVKLGLQDSKSSELFLEPGEVVSYSATHRLLISPQKIEHDIPTSWKQGILTFKKTSFGNILEELAATNNFEFEITDSVLVKKEFSLSIPNNDVGAAISILSKTANTEFTKQGNKYIFKPKQ